MAKKEAMEHYLVQTKPGAHFLLQHDSYLISSKLKSSVSLLPLSPVTMTQTPQPSRFLAVDGPIPLQPPGPKLIA